MANSLVGLMLYGQLNSLFNGSWLVRWLI